MENQLNIREYKQTDFDSLVELWILTGMSGKERKDDQNVIERTIKNGGFLIILEKKKKIIGTCWLTHDNRRTYLHHFAIHPEFQGKGYANILMDASLEYIKKIGFQVKLEVSKDNFKALNLYRKYKFIDFNDYELMMKRDI